MPAKRQDVRERIELLRSTCDVGDSGAVLEAVRKALRDRHYLLVARAAELTAERLLFGLETDLAAAYRRFLDNAVKRDPNCAAKGAIVRALVALDWQDADFYVAGLHYRQLEPVWGGTLDTAVDLRSSCAAGLAATAYPRALVEIVDLLHDPEPNARSAAVRAVACAERIGAEAVLRSKALAGDAEAEVTGECLAALLRLAPDDALMFVASFLDDPNPSVQELAALALGESRLDAALHLLRTRWEAQPFKRDTDRSLLRAAVLHRSEAAIDWLLSVVRRGDRESAELVMVALAAYRSAPGLSARMGDVVKERAEEHLLARFAQVW